MAADYFLQITGIDGESTDAKHKGWIDVESWSWGETNPGVRATGGGAGAGKVQMQDFHFATTHEQGEPEAVPGLRDRPAHEGGQARRASKSGAMQQEFLTLDVHRRARERLPDQRLGGDDIVDGPGLAQLRQGQGGVQGAEGRRLARRRRSSAGWDVEANKKF